MLLLDYILLNLMKIILVKWSQWKLDYLANENLYHNAEIVFGSGGGIYELFSSINYFQTNYWFCKINDSVHSNINFAMCIDGK